MRSNNQVLTSSPFSSQSSPQSISKSTDDTKIMDDTENMASLSYQESSASLNDNMAQSDKATKLSSSKMRLPWTDGEKIRFIPYEAVKSNLSNMNPVTPTDLPMLAGRESGYKSLHVHHHRVSIREAAVQIERLRKTAGRRRRRAIGRAWTWLTEYKTFRDAYSNTQEKRMLTDTGIQEPDLVFNDADADADAGDADDSNEQV